jgi:membrane protein
VRGFTEDDISDRAATLTYYAIMSVFPGLLVLISVFGLVGGPASEFNDLIGQVVPGQAGEILTNAVNQVNAAGAVASVAAIAGLVVALWSASGYVAAFIRAANAMYGVPEGRPIAKRLALRLALTVVMGLLLLVSLAIVLLTGGVAERLGQALGIGQGTVTAWDIAKWPVLVILLGVIIGVLYWFSPNARRGRFRWVTPGSLTAVVAWLVLSAAFGLYLATLASYQRTYGAISSVIVFLIWLWLSNLAILLGAELDAELERARAMAAGHRGEPDPFLPTRDGRAEGDAEHAE